MNAFKLNGVIGHHSREAIADGLNVPHRDIYKEVLHILPDGTILTKKGKAYKLTLTEIK
jgi:hypothetical protein